MPFKPRIASLLVAALLSCPLAGAVGAEEPAKSSNVLLTVDGVAVDQDLYLAFYNERKGQGRANAKPDEEQAQLLGELVNFVLLRLEAEHTGVTQRPDVIAGMQLAVDQYLAGVVINEELRKNPITEAELRGVYEAQFLSTKEPDFKVRHILLGDEAAAREVIAELGKGADFSKLAKERSTDPSKDQGGELGWMHSGDMDPNLEKALKEMKPGQISAEPVKTDFGWHVLMLDGRRDPPKPPFEKVKGQIIQAKQRERVSSYLNELKQRAKIEATNPAQAPKP